MEERPADSYRGRLFTIGFTKTSAEHFFSRLSCSGVRKLVDVRLKNTSGLAGFSKKNDLEFFLRELCSIDYEHVPTLAPSQEILEGFKNKNITWEEYEKSFKALLEERRVVNAFNPADFEGACLLCSEPTATNCHRRLVAELLRDSWPEIKTIIHL